MEVKYHTGKIGFYLGGEIFVNHFCPNALKGGEKANSGFHDKNNFVTENCNPERSYLAKITGYLAADSL